MLNTQETQKRVCSEELKKTIAYFRPAIAYPAHCVLRVVNVFNAA